MIVCTSGPDFSSVRSAPEADSALEVEVVRHALLGVVVSHRERRPDRREALGLEVEALRDDGDLGIDHLLAAGRTRLPLIASAGDRATRRAAREHRGE